MRIYLCSRIGRLNTIDMAMLPNNLQIQCNPTKIPTAFFFLVEIDKLVKCLQKFKEYRIALKSVGKNKVGRLTLPNFKIYCQVTVIKTLWSGLSIDIQINGIQLRLQKQMHTSIVNCSLTRMPIPFDEERIVVFQQMASGQLDFHMRKN